MWILPTIYPGGAADPPGWKGRRDIVFIGGFAHAPNVDAVLFFTSEIFPLIRLASPTPSSRSSGPTPTPEISELSSPNVQILGFVPDVKPIFDRAIVSVAPIRFGAGVKGKVNQSMSFGVPTVVTSIAAEGMYLTHGENARHRRRSGELRGCCRSPLDVARTVAEGFEKRPADLAQHFSVEAAAAPIDDLLQWAGLKTLAVK